MLKLIVSLLLLANVYTDVQAAHHIGGHNVAQHNPIALLKANTDNTVEHYTLGNVVDDAVSIYQAQSELIFDSLQKEVVLRIKYPIDDTVQDVDAAALITQIDLYMEGSDGFQSQAYITAGGIGERTISLQIELRNTASLNYTVIINGQKP